MTCTLFRVKALYASGQRYRKRIEEINEFVEFHGERGWDAMRSRCSRDAIEAEPKSEMRPLMRPRCSHDRAALRMWVQD